MEHGLHLQLAKDTLRMPLIAGCCLRRYARD